MSAFPIALLLALAAVPAPLIGSALGSAVPVLAFQTPAVRDAAPPAANDVLPDSPAGRCARAWFELFAEPWPDGVDLAKAVRDFETAHASKARLGRTGLDERATRMQPLRDEWGTMTVERVTSASSTSLSLHVRSSRRGPVDVEFQFDPEGKLDAISLATGNGEPSQPLTPARRTALIAAACAGLTDEYVFPEKGKAMADALQSAASRGAYDSITDESAFVARMTDDLRAVTRDKHLRVRIQPIETNREDAVVRGGLTEFRRENWGFRSVEIKEGNVGVLRFDHFGNDPEARAIADAAMAFLARCDALIFDLRQNGGGSPTMINHLSSYLFDQPTLLNRMIDRDGNVVGEGHTDASVAGTRFRPDLPVFVLTSSRTFSGAEEFAYNLKNLKRATIVGETTGGGAHPVKPVRLDDRIVIVMPFLRAENPITKTNWEGVGVHPDVEVEAAKALERALDLARSQTGPRR
jgi:retinol-binding protein 3